MNLFYLKNISAPPKVEYLNPCEPSPCGANAECKVQRNAGSCSCLPDYFGDPYQGCRPECLADSDCPLVSACNRNKCIDPCPGVCGYNADCYVTNHKPMCNCKPGYTGTPLSICHPIRGKKLLSIVEMVNFFMKIKINYTISENDIAVINVCNPSPCGTNAVCREVNNQPVCSCLPNYMGSPPNCKPECVVNSECKSNRACVNQRCINPCPKPCGQNTECKVINHSPVCTCRPGYSGNAFTMCSLIMRKFICLQLNITLIY